MTVLVLNKDFSPLAFVDMPRAVSLLVSEHYDPVTKRMVPQATMFKADPTRLVRSQYLAIEWPKIIALTRYVYRPYSARLQDPSGFATSKDILDRDRRLCAYCGKKADTIDHVFPRSRGGADSWENLVAACRRCNNRKADRTPEEWCRDAGPHKPATCQHKLRWQPYHPDTAGTLQTLIWDELELILSGAPDAPA